MNEPRQPKETLSWGGRSDRPGRRAVDRLISGRVRTTLTTVAVSGLAVTALGLGTASLMHDPSAGRPPESASVPTTPDDDLWGGPDAVARRIHAAHEGALWGGPDAAARRIHAANEGGRWGGPDALGETRVGQDMETDRLARCTQAVRRMALPHNLEAVNRCMIRH